MKRALFITATVFFLFTIISCTHESIEEIQQKELIQKEMAQYDTEPVNDGTIDDEDTDEE